jgi:hypothetical protein
MLVDLLRDKETLAVERLFRLLGLLHPREDFQRIHRGLRDHDNRTRESSRELLQNLLRPPLGEAVLGIVDRASEAERLRRGGPYLPPAAPAPEAAATAISEYAAVVAALLTRRSPPLCALAAYHAGELRLTELRPALEAAHEREDGYARAAVGRALSQLADPASEPRRAAGGEP